MRILPKVTIYDVEPPASLREAILEQEDDVLPWLNHRPGRAGTKLGEVLGLHTRYGVRSVQYIRYGSLFAYGKRPDGNFAVHDAHANRLCDFEQRSGIKERAYAVIKPYLTADPCPQCWQLKRDNG